MLIYIEYTCLSLRRDAARANPIDFFPFAQGKVLPAAEQDKIAMSIYIYIYAQLSHEITHAFPSKEKKLRKHSSLQNLGSHELYDSPIPEIPT
jgi:hypothetical protein